MCRAYRVGSSIVFDFTIGYKFSELELHKVSLQNSVIISQGLSVNETAASIMNSSLCFGTIVMIQRFTKKYRTPIIFKGEWTSEPHRFFFNYIHCRTFFHKLSALTDPPLPRVEHFSMSRSILALLVKKKFTDVLVGGLILLRIISYIVHSLHSVFNYTIPRYISLLTIDFQNKTWRQKIPKSWMCTWQMCKLLLRRSSNRLKYRELELAVMKIQCTHKYNSCNLPAFTCWKTYHLHIWTGQQPRKSYNMHKDSVCNSPSQKAEFHHVMSQCMSSSFNALLICFYLVWQVIW